MLKAARSGHRGQQGTTLLEVLVTILILACGLLGIAGLQSKVQLAEMEAYQRAQAVLLLSDMVERIHANYSAAADYALGGTAAPLGVGDGQPPACGPGYGAARDLCEWSNALKGASETTSTAQRAGAMIGARGCIETLQPPDATTGVCTPGIYRVTVTWQGLNPTVAPALLCANGLYGAGNLQRSISASLTLGLPGC